MVRFGEQYAEVSPQVISNLRATASSKTGLHSLAKDAERIKPNSSVRINNGPFFGLQGIFVRECGEDRVLVLLNILGQDRPVEIEEGFVGPA